MTVPLPLYINDLPDCVTSSIARLFTDDTFVFCHIASCNDADALQRDTGTLQQWTDTWFMQFIPSKCQVLRVTLKQKPVKASYTINGQTLEEVDSAKLLGMDIDSKLTFSNHVDSICKRANSSRAFLSRNLRSCTKDTHDITYITYLRPTVEYASTVWDPHTCRNTNKREQVQCHSARYVTGNRDYNCRMVQDLGWSTLEQHCWNSRLTVMYKIFNHQVDDDFLSKCSLSQSITRGHASCIVQPKCSCVICSNSFPRTTRDWNVLPVDPSTIHTVDAFKSYLKPLKCRLSIAFSLIVFICRKRGVPGWCALILCERLHFYGRRRRLCCYL